jgi:hypothetical protein
MRSPQSMRAGRRTAGERRQCHCQTWKGQDIMMVGRMRFGWVRGEKVEVKGVGDEEDRAFVGGWQMQGDESSEQNATVERDNLLSKKPRVR